MLAKGETSIKYRQHENYHLDLSRCPLLHKSLQPVLRTVRVVIQPESSGWRIINVGDNNTMVFRLCPTGVA